MTKGGFLSAPADGKPMLKTFQETRCDPLALNWDDAPRTRDKIIAS
jgi:hypothetical protein